MKLERIEKIVQQIVSRCKEEGVVEVSETLAAFMARTVVENDSKSFCLDKKMNEDDIHELIDICVHRLIQTDSPSLETVKMQIAMNVAYSKSSKKPNQDKSMKEKKVDHFHRLICSKQLSNSNDFDSLTSLYREIFNLLMFYANTENTEECREIEREVAASLESVFPRIGLKTFIGLSNEEKIVQLKELVHVVIGIRLFNRELGKGGIGMVDSIDSVQNLIAALKAQIQADVQRAMEDCTQYTDILLRVHSKKAFNELGKETISRLQEELENRRQYLSYAQSLLEDVLSVTQHLESHFDQYEAEMADLKELVGSRSSVPKEQVYPKFVSIAKLWNLIIEQKQVLETRGSCRMILKTYSISYIPTIGSLLYILEDAKKEGPIVLENLFFKDSQDNEIDIENLQIQEEKDFKEHWESQEKDVSKNPLEDQNVAVRLSIETTPELMQLPLEYQGYCPWTICHKDGLLLLGDPSLGVVRYQNTFNVFVNERAMNEFIQNPSAYVQQIHSIVRKRPQLIHLLRVQDLFDESSFGQFLGKNSSVECCGTNNAPPQMVDVGTGTPTHFVEKHIDPNYEWNEWSMRRKGLKLANLRKCTTTSVQTNASRFRRSMESQVYVARDETTQTPANKGTNTRRTVTYLAGLRGTNPTSCSKYTKESQDNRPSIVNLTLDL